VEVSACRPCAADTVSANVMAGLYSLSYPLSPNLIKDSPLYAECSAEHLGQRAGSSSHSAFSTLRSLYRHLQSRHIFLLLPEISVIVFF
jgi:hypothetical protein